MAIPNVSAHPVNIIAPQRHEIKELNFHALPGSKFQPPPAEEDNDIVMQSLRLTVDPRFKAIKHYRDSRGDDRHFQELMKGAKVPDMTGVNSSADMSFHDIVSIERAEKAGTKFFTLQDRMRWQEAFDKNVNQLLIDFDLTHEPCCRLNHLDRMHSWFTEHGGKQQRKAKKAPNYITVDRTTHRMPAGSTRDFGGKLSGTSQLLAGSYLMRGRVDLNKSAHADGSQTAR